MSALYEKIIARSVEVDGCLTWTGAAQPTGYGQIWNGTRPEQTHRVVYRHVYGEIPEGCEIDHICKNRSCVKPEHLRAVTHRENILNSETIMAVNSRKTECKRGHTLSGVNLRINKSGERICRECIRLHAIAYRARKKGVCA